MKWEFSWNGILKFCFLKITIDGINLTFQSFKWKLKRIEKQSMEGKSKKEMMDRKVKEKEDRRLKVRRPICSRLYRDSCGDTWYNCPSNIFLPTTLRPGKFFYQCPRIVPRYLDFEYETKERRNEMQNGGIWYEIMFSMLNINNL